MPDPFFEAAQSGDVRALARRLQADPDRCTAYSADGWTALHLAAYFGHAAAVRLLLERGADVHARSTNDTANTPLHAALAGAREAATVGLLLDHGADVNAPAGAGVTPLHLAAARGDLALIDRLLAQGAVPTPMEGGATPADLAAERGHPEAARRLAKPA